MLIRCRLNNQLLNREFELLIYNNNGDVIDKKKFYGETNIYLDKYFDGYIGIKSPYYYPHSYLEKFKNQDELYFDFYNNLTKTSTIILHDKYYQDLIIKGGKIILCQKNTL